MASTLLGGRVEVSRGMGVLAAGDALMIAVFVVAGEARHAGTVAAGVETFVQFGIGWVLAALLVGAYTRGAVATRRRAAGIAFGAWVVAALIGQGIRVVTEASAGISPAFVLVSIGVGGILLVAWRTIAAGRLVHDTRVG